MLEEVTEMNREDEDKRLLKLKISDVEIFLIHCVF